MAVTTELTCVYVDNAASTADADAQPGADAFSRRRADDLYRVVINANRA